MMDLFSPLFAKIFGTATIALALVAGVQTFRLSRAHDRIETLESRLKAERAQYDAERARAIATRLQAEATNREVNNATEQRAKQAYEAGRAAADRYARAHSLRAGTPCTVAPPSAVPDAPERDNGAGQGADMVALSREDFDTLTENTVRLQQVHEWGEQMIAAGLAAPEFGNAP